MLSWILYMTAMGTLAFSDLDVVMVGPDAAYVFGRWELTRVDDRPHGLFTLILVKNLPGGTTGTMSMLRKAS